MAAIFDKIKITKPKTSVFDLSHERKMSMNMGDLVPAFVQEVIPGDYFKVNMEHLLRYQPLLAPIMHRVNVYTHFFFVPNRLVWNEWENFIGGGRNGDSMPVFPRIRIWDQTIPTSVKPLLTTGSLADYMGVPCSNGITDNSKVEFSALPFRAYQLIYNEYYRDQNLSEPVDFLESSGIIDNNWTETIKLLSLRKRAWEKDYFTSALPWAQRGEQLTIPLSGTAPVSSNGEIPQMVSYVTGFPLGLNPLKTLSSNGNIVESSSEAPLKFGAETGLEADMTNVTSSTINELRQGFAIQKWLEKNARGGARYIEQLFSHFGVVSDDARLQRPEYLGGGKTPVIISEVLQTSQSTETSPQANMSGHGISVGNTNEFKAKFKEHGYVIGIMSVIPRTSYQNGLPRHLQKYDKFDYFWPDLAHIGEQEVKNSELYYNTNVPDDNNGTFGYQPRYAEYRFAPDTVHGDMATNLDFWHMGRKFTSLPPLNSSFIEANPTDRIFAVEDPTEHKLIVQTYCNFQAIRPIPKYGTPSGL